MFPARLEIDLMRVLFVAPTFLPRLGGAERLLHELACGLVANGAIVRVVTPTPGPVTDGPLEIHRLPRRNTFYRQDTVLPMALDRQISAFRPDVIQTSGPCITEPLAVPVFKGRRVPAVSLYHAGFSDAIWLARAYSSFHTVALRAFDRVVTTNERLSATLRERGLSPERVCAIPPGVSAGFVPGDGSKREPFLLFVGALDEDHRYKRVDLLLQACAEVFRDLPGFRLAVVGRGELTETYRNLAGQLGIADRVDFLTGVDDAGLADLYRRASVFVLASATLQEGFGIVAIEAMASGCPVIVTAAAGCADVVRDAGGAVVPPGDTAALAHAIRTILADPAAQAETSRRAASCAAQMRWPAIARRWIAEVYAPLMSA